MSLALHPIAQELKRVRVRVGGGGVGGWCITSKLVHLKLVYFNAVNRHLHIGSLKVFRERCQLFSSFLPIHPTIKHTNSASRTTCSSLHHVCGANFPMHTSQREWPNTSMCLFAPKFKMVLVWMRFVRFCFKGYASSASQLVESLDQHFSPYNEVETQIYSTKIKALAHFILPYI